MELTLTGASVRGSVTFDAAVLRDARQVARTQYDTAVRDDFSGDLVETYALPEWLPALATWFPFAEVAAMGLEPDPDQAPELVGTCGVDPHVDDIHGHVFIAVLHNDHLRFAQGRQRHITRAGEWFVFDDRVPHAVKDTVSSTCYLCVAVPLRLLSA